VRAVTIKSSLMSGCG